MTLQLGRNINKADIATVSDAIAVNTSTSVKVADANPDRIFLHINNDANDLAFWIKLQPASIDNDKKGIFADKEAKGRFDWEMPSDNIYTGEISVVSDASNQNIYVTEY